MPPVVGELLTCAIDRSHAWGFTDRPQRRYSHAMEEVLPPQTMDGSGYEPTRVRQYTVFLENKVGRLQSLVRALEQGSGKIVAMSMHESADSALIRLICSDPD